MPDSFQLEMIVAAEPQRVFSAWMDSREHAAFTGGGEAVVEPWAGGRFIAWDGYIHGILLGVDEGRRIVQTWRTSEFPPEARDSRLVVEFEPARGGTRVIVRHSDLPSSHVKKYERGWTEHYLKALARYLIILGTEGGTPGPASAKGARAQGGTGKNDPQGSSEKAGAQARPQDAARSPAQGFRAPFQALTAPGHGRDRDRRRRGRACRGARAQKAGLRGGGA
ncbi:MAG: hypothetical protein E6J82_19165 [Deltaproteobacteria bacterium]|nr:MAG: hypothetical protein E6J82_19165 [Deltaproteobacteria bacterium]